ncbi:MAG TPA: 3-demethylubiquinone-9 3-O-methyltransferase, partial [Candidatus Dormibacteraeota bacterium]|nr:3-demethylubiquinone-9 3-O-methyltransferase [Candidatus Dormibacteraeota bacterium]
RTLLSKLGVIKLLQDWRVTSVFPPRFHAWEQFITLDELQASLARHGLRGREVIGAAVRANPLRTLWAIRRYKAGRLSAAAVGRHVTLREGPSVALSYMGYATH